jgi:hypothetical protein
MPRPLPNVNEIVAHVKELAAARATEKTAAAPAAVLTTVLAQKLQKFASEISAMPENDNVVTVDDVVNFARGLM